MTHISKCMLTWIQLVFIKPNCFFYLGTFKWFYLCKDIVHCTFKKGKEKNTHFLVGLGHDYRILTQNKQFIVFKLPAAPKMLQLFLKDLSSSLCNSFASINCSSTPTF